MLFSSSLLFSNSGQTCVDAESSFIQLYKTIKSFDIEDNVMNTQYRKIKMYINKTSLVYQERMSRFTRQKGFKIIQTFIFLKDCTPSFHVKVLNSNNFILRNYGVMGDFVKP